MVAEVKVEPPSWRDDDADGADGPVCRIHGVDGASHGQAVKQQSLHRPRPRSRLVMYQVGQSRGTSHVEASRGPKPSPRLLCLPARDQVLQTTSGIPMYGPVQDRLRWQRVGDYHEAFSWRGASPGTSRRRSTPAVVATSREATVESRKMMPDAFWRGFDSSSMVGGRGGTRRKIHTATVRLPPHPLPRFPLVGLRQCSRRRPVEHEW